MELFLMLSFTYHPAMPTDVMAHSMPTVLVCHGHYGDYGMAWDGPVGSGNHSVPLPECGPQCAGFTPGS